MIIKKISLKNIRSYKSCTIELPEGNILLSGDIGSGKTSILLAIEFALFGLQPGQKGSSILRSGENSGSVVLELIIDGRMITIERRLKRSSKSVSQEYASLTIDGSTQDISATELKTKILSMLNYPQEFLKKTNLLYRYTVYSPQEEMKQIILENPESRLNVIRHIFGVDKYRRIKDNLQIVISRIKEKVKNLQIQTAEISLNREDLSLKKSLVQELSLLISEREKELALKEQVRKKIELEIESLREKIDEKNKLESEISKANIMLLNKQAYISDTEAEIREIEKKLSEKRDVFNQRDLDSLNFEIESVSGEIDSLNSSIIDISAKINSLKIKKQEDLEKRNRIFRIDICPTCLQSVPEGHKHNILHDTEKSLVNSENIISKLNADLHKIVSLCEGKKTELASLQKKKSDLEILKLRQEELSASILKKDALLKSLENHKKDSLSLESHIKSLKSSVFSLAKYDSMYSAKEAELKNAFQAEKEVEIDIAKIKKETELLEKDISILNHRISEKEKALVELNSLLEMEEWLSNDFSNLILFAEKNIMFSLRREFSRLFNKWFETLTTDSFSSHLDENFTPVIMQGEYELDYSFLSGGERTAIALAYRLALNQIINSIFSRIKTRNLVILDEPTDGFSDQQLDKVRDVLQELDVEQLILVSHEPKIESFVDNVIRLKKEHGITKEIQA